MNRTDVVSLLSDLEELIGVTRDALDAADEGSRLTLVHLANARECLRKVVESYEPDRPSCPPSLWGSNQQGRRTATERFQAARKILKGIKP